MYAVIRNYAGNAELADQLVARQGEVVQLVSEIDGFRGYYLLRTEDGCASVTVYDDKAGADRSSEVARDWLAEHASELTASTPAVMSGEVLVNAGG